MNQRPPLNSAKHQNILGIKDSSADVPKLTETINLTDDGFAVLTGNGTVLFDALSAGACGGILAVGCVATAICIEIFRAVEAGEVDRAATLQARLTPLAAAVTTRFGIGGLKAALELKGFVGGQVRSPLLSAGDEAREGSTPPLFGRRRAGVGRVCPGSPRSGVNRLELCPVWLVQLGHRA